MITFEPAGQLNVQTVNDGIFVEINIIITSKHVNSCVMSSKNNNKNCQGVKIFKVDSCPFPTKDGKV